MRSITDQVEIKTDAQSVFNALITPSAIQKWWNAQTAMVLPKVDGFWAATWGENLDDPDYIVAAMIREFESPWKLVLTDYLYHSKDFAPPTGYDPTTEYRISPSPSGSLLTVIQSGFPNSPESEKFFQGCLTGWQATRQGIKDFLER